jgi:hypothetical protein
MITVVHTGIAEEDDNDVLDPGHFYLVLKAWPVHLQPLI